jgi:DNA-binding response OmpR family regulator/HPt (histidine-containing phosphotransfer) domain-containing protein
MKILCVEDDKTTAAAMLGLLTQEHYIVEIAPDAEWAWQLVQQFKYDLLILDITLPDLDGISLCRQIRIQNKQTPILIVSSHDQIQEKAIGLDAGADDYLVKPFHPDELFARIRALLRRGTTDAIGNCLNWGNIHLNTSSAEVNYCSSVLPLTPKEYAILELLLRNPKRVFSCSAILDNLWPNADAPSEEAVRTHIKGLRQKLRAGGEAEEVVETVYGIGYRLKAIDEQAIAECPLDSNASSDSNANSDFTKTKALIQEVWVRSSDRIKAQLDSIQTGVDGLSQDIQTDSSDRSIACINSAHRDAHTLAGSLGTFGFTEASHLAKKIEHLFQQFDQLTPNEINQMQPLLDHLRKEISL